MKTSKVVFINANGGRVKKPGELDKLREILRQFSDVEVKVLGKHDNPTLLAKQAVAQGAVAVGAAGGDGTLNAVASGLVGTKVPFVVLPFGTLNHFARDIGLSDDLAKAAALLTHGPEKIIDVGQVNQRYFLNNSSLGIYPHLVQLREQREKDLGKWRAYVWAAIQTLQHPTSYRVRLQLKKEGQPQSLQIGLVFVANNRCDVGLPHPGKRVAFDEGLLDLYVMEAKNEFSLLMLAWHYLTNRLDEAKIIRHTDTTDFTITAGRRNINIATDGEVNRLSMPIHYQSVQAALHVRVPETEA